MKTKYRALRIVKWIYRLIGLLVLISGVIAGIVLLTSPAPVIDSTSSSVSISLSGVPVAGVGIGVILSSIFTALVFEGIAEVLSVLMDTEENTLLTTVLLKQMIRSQGKGNSNRATSSLAPSLPPRKKTPQELLDTESEF
ncbi:MAG: hypothetical protein R3E39_22435 [Anaerolineae bacterium]